MTEQATEIVNVLAELLPDDGARLEARAGSQARTHAQAIQGELVPRLEENPAYATLWQQFEAQPQAQAPILAGIVQVLIQNDPVLETRLQALLRQYQAAVHTASPKINTGGGAYVGGNVDVKDGDFVGRDSLHITGDGNVVGNHSSSTVIKQEGIDIAALEQAFTNFYTAVAQQPELPTQDKVDLQAELRDVEAELKKGEEADEGFIRRRLRNIRRMAPDIYDVVLTTFGNPIAGLGMVAKKIAEKMKSTKV